MKTNVTNQAVICKICGKTNFKNQRGLNIHIGKKHKNTVSAVTDFIQSFNSSGIESR